MSARLTVVLDDEDLYRAVKVRAAEQGVPLKSIIESALKSYIEDEKPAEVDGIEWDWNAYDEWQREVEALGRELGPDAPTDLSNTKEHLYEFRTPRLWLLGEEQEPYESE